MTETPSYPPYSPSNYSPPLSPWYSSSSPSTTPEKSDTSFASIAEPTHEVPDIKFIVEPEHFNSDDDEPRMRLQQTIQDLRTHLDSNFAEYSDGVKKVQDDLQRLEDEQEENIEMFQGQLQELQDEFMETVLGLSDRIKQVENMSSESQNMLDTNANNLKGITLTADMFKDIKTQLDSGKSIKDIVQMINSEAPAGTLQPNKVCTRQQSAAVGAGQSSPTPVLVPTVGQKGKKKPPGRKNKNRQPAQRVNCEYCKTNLSITYIKQHMKSHCSVLKQL